MARNTRFCFSGCSKDSQSPRIWSSLSGIHRRMLGCQGNVAPKDTFFPRKILRTNSVHCEEIWRNMSLKSSNIDMNLMIYGCAELVELLECQMGSMMYKPLAWCFWRHTIGTELASAAVSGTGSNAPEELSKLERDWAKIVGWELSSKYSSKGFQGDKSPARF